MPPDPSQQDRWAKYLGSPTSGCTGCQKRRSKIIQALSRKAIVLFSGGLDSTYAALTLRKKYDVELWHASWTYEGYESNLETERAKAIAEKLGLPLFVMGSWVTFKEHAQGAGGHIMRVPVLATAVLSHRTLQSVGTLAFGGHPSEYKWDARWVEFLQDAVESLRPGTQILSPCDGIPRQKMLREIPNDIRSLLFSCYQTTQEGERCGKCDKCRADAA